MTENEDKACQVGGDHYDTGEKVQWWDIGVVHNLPAIEWTVCKYILRYKRKDGLKDLEKALSYINKLCEYRPMDSMELGTVAMYERFAYVKILDDYVHKLKGTEYEVSPTELLVMQETFKGNLKNARDMCKILIGLYKKTSE